MNCAISMKLENHSDMRVFEREANHPIDLFPSFSGLVMRYLDEIFRSLDRAVQAFISFFKEDLWVPMICCALN